MESLERGSPAWVRQQTELVVTDATLLIDAAIAAQRWTQLRSGNLMATLDTAYRQIDEALARTYIEGYLEEIHGITTDDYILTIWYGRDYDEARDVFRFEIVYAPAN